MPKFRESNRVYSRDKAWNVIYGNDSEISTEGNEGNKERQKNTPVKLVIFVNFVSFCIKIRLSMRHGLPTTSVRHHGRRSSGRVRTGDV